MHGTNIREQAWEIIGTLKKLKTLDVSYNRDLSGIPRDIGELQQLKTLDVRGTRITELPREIGNLQRLVYLDLLFTAITKVPRDIGKLQHLEYLDLRSTKVRKMPREIGAMQNLKYLKVDVNILPLEAGQLSKLVGLPSCVRQAWKNNHLVSSLAGEILSFEKVAGFRGNTSGLTVGTKHMHIPQWIKEHFNNIGTLDVRICKLEEQDLKILREMPNLWDLKLRFEAIPRKPIAISGEGFANLECLTVDSRVPRITFQEGAMPTLEWLTFQFQFYGGPPNTDPMGIKHLVSLGCVRFQCKKWYRGDSPCISAMIDVVRKETREHRNMIEFQVWQGSVVAHERFPANSIITQSSQDGNVACSSSGVEPWKWKRSRRAVKLAPAVRRKRSRRSKLNPYSAQHM
jgi:hypothetical protein